MASKPGKAKGSDHGSSKLTEDDVRWIRAEYARTAHLSPQHPDRMSQRKLGARFGVTGITIHNIIHHNIWKHI